MTENVWANIRDFYSKVELFEFGVQVKTNVDILDIRLTNIIRIVNNMLYLFEIGRDVEFEYMQCAKLIKTTEYAIGIQRVLQDNDIEFVRRILDELKIKLYLILDNAKNTNRDRMYILSHIQSIREDIIAVVNRFKDCYSRNLYLCEN